MGRKRTKGFDLPPRMYKLRAAYWYFPRYGKPINLGRDLTVAKRKWAELENPASEAGSLESLINWYMAEIAPKKAPRTYSDNKGESANLIKGLGHIPYRELRPHHVAVYRDERGKDAPVRANREKALLSHVFTKAMEKGWVDMNPCIGVKRNREKKRERYIEDAEFWKVYDKAVDSVKIIMSLIYRTAQRPEDLILVGPMNVRKVKTPDGDVSVLRVRQQKTQKTVDIRIEGELAGLIDRHNAAKIVHETFVHTRQGKVYTYDGLSAMFRRYVNKTGLTDFGMYDIKAKAATDMFRMGVPLERIQQLLGHDSITTTEIYIKARLAEVVSPNSTEIVRQDQNQAAV